MKILGILFLLIGFFYSSTNAYAISDGKTREDIKQLEKRIKQLESGRKKLSIKQYLHSHWAFTFIQSGNQLKRITSWNIQLRR